MAVQRFILIIMLFVCVCLSEHHCVRLRLMHTYHTAIIKGTGDPLLGEFSVSYRLDPEAC